MAALDGFHKKMTREFLTHFYSLVTFCSHSKTGLLLCYDTIILFNGLVNNKRPL